MNKAEVEVNVRLLEKQIEEIQQKALETISPLRHAIRNLRLRVAGVSVGDIVAGRKGKDYRVIDINTRGANAWVTGNPRKKDGTFGTAKRNLYDDWELKQPVGIDGLKI